MTDMQDQMLSFLESYPDKGFSSKDLWGRFFKGNPWNGVSSAAVITGHLRPLVNQGFLKNNKGVYQAQEILSTQEILSAQDVETPCMDKTSEALILDDNQQDLVVDALVYYAQHIMGFEREKAVEALKLVVLIEGDSEDCCPCKQKTDAHEEFKATPITKTDCQPFCIARKGGLPATMTYKEFIAKVNQAFEKGLFDYRILAGTLSMSQDYLYRVCQGQVCEPPRDRLDAIYSTIFG